MKKLLFLFFLPLWGLVGIAHASVAVQVLATDFTNKTVTLRVEYDYAVNDRVWVWIYLCDMQGMFQPAVISEASATSGSVLYLSTNTRGFFVTASPTTVTATLNNASGQFSCCAYGSDAPPNMMESNGTYTFKGTPPFMLIAADGTTTQTVTENTLPASALTITPVTITDETGYPFCIYTGSDLYMDASHLCQQRASGAKNWEAYIKDSRDNRIYRIVKMPTGTWWMADDLLWDGKPSPDATNYTVRGTPRACGAHNGCGRFYLANSTGTGAYGGTDNDRRSSDACPTGWLIPSRADAAPYLIGDSFLEYRSTKETNGLDTYGLSLYLCDGGNHTCGTAYTTIRCGSCTMWRAATGTSNGCNEQVYNLGVSVRCVRDL